MSQRTITFLGTGAGDFHEEHQRDCEEGHCARAKALGGRNLRRAASLFIAPDLLIDFHNIQQPVQQGIEPSSVRHLFITHGHFDHFQPVAILDLAGLPGCEFTLYGSHGVRDAMEFAAAYVWDAGAGMFRCRDGSPPVPVRPLRPGETVQAGDAKVTALLANHMIDKGRQILEQEALNYIIERGGRTLLYALDTSSFLPRTFEALTEFRFDIVVLDGTFGWMQINPATSGHHNFPMVEDTVRQLRSAGVLADDAQVIASHISCHHVPPHDDIADDLAERGITLAHDGMEVEF